MKIALVHEFLTQLGGAERVLKNFLQEWPEARLNVLISSDTRTHGEFKTYQKQMSKLNYLPGVVHYHRWLLPLMPWAIEQFKFNEFDVVLSDSSSFAKGVKSQGKLHICYCHTPTRFLWTESEKYIEAQPNSPIVKFLAKLILPWLRRWDLEASKRPDYFIANSENVRQRILKYYQRDSIVIPPPVDTEFFKPQGVKQSHYLAASRLEPYKKIELVVSVFNDLGLPLKVAGTGTNLDKLRAMAKSNIEFLGRVSDEQLRTLYSEAQAFVFPAEEDAGIMVLEAQACGTPVIAFGKGGSLETILPGVTGEFFKEQTIDSLKSTLQNFNPLKYNPELIRANAQKYDNQVFRRKIREFVETKYQEQNSQIRRPIA